MIRSLQFGNHKYLVNSRLLLSIKHNPTLSKIKMTDSKKTTCSCFNFDAQFLMSFAFMFPAIPCSILQNYAQCFKAKGFFVKKNFLSKRSRIQLHQFLQLLLFTNFENDFGKRKYSNLKRTKIYILK